MIVEENDCVGCEVCINCSRMYPRRFHVCDRCEDTGQISFDGKSHLYKYKDGEYCYSCVHNLIEKDLSDDDNTDIDSIIDDLEEVDNNDCYD